MKRHSVADRAARTDAPLLPRRGVRPVVLAAVSALAIATPAVAITIRHDSARGVASAALAATPQGLRDLTRQPYILFRSTRVDADYGRLTVAPASNPTSTRLTSPLKCDRVDFASGRGVCLTQALPGALGDSGVQVFDANLRTTHTLALSGFPSRARMSPDGAYAAVTLFTRGHSYATPGKFSMRTDLLDLATGKVVLPLEKLRVTKDGRPFRRVDFNFWGVTFLRDGDGFYATLGTGGHTYLIAASRSRRTATVIADGVECPSVSPDQTRIAFKQRDGGSGVSWHLAVMDLSTRATHRLSTTGDVDDQAMWLDDRTVSYGQVDAGPGGGNPSAMGLSRLINGGTVATSMWAVPADGAGSPRKIMAGAWSARVVEP